MSPGDAQMQDVTAVIAAAGSGERLGAGGPKAFVPLAGRPMVEWSMLAFQRAGVAAIVVACPPGLAAGLEGDPGRAGEGPAAEAVDGGETRAASVANALAAVGTDLVAIHDAARPLLTPELIEGVVGALRGAGPDVAGAILAAPVTDTIKLAPGDRVGERVIPVGTTRHSMSRGRWTVSGSGRRRRRRCSGSRRCARRWRARGRPRRPMRRC